MEPSPSNARSPVGRPAGRRRIGGRPSLRLAWLLAGIACLGALALAVGLVPGATSQSPPASPLVGVVISIDSHGLGDVRGFTLLSTAGRTISFSLGPLENGNQFPPGHLAEHQATAAPIRVYFRSVNGILTAYRLEDAR